MRESGTGRVPLHIAIRTRCSDEVIYFLLDRCPESARIQDILGRLPLHYAISNNVGMGLIERLVSQCPESSRAVDHMVSFVSFICSFCSFGRSPCHSLERYGFLKIKFA